MTYEEFLDRERTKALKVIIEQKARYSYAQRLFQNYQISMGSLSLSPLTWLEIGDRLADLEIAERDLDADYADSDIARARYEREFSTLPSVKTNDESPDLFTSVAAK